AIRPGDPEDRQTGKRVPPPTARHGFTPPTSPGNSKPLQASGGKSPLPPSPKKDKFSTGAFGRTSSIAESTGQEIPQEVLEMMKNPDYCFQKFVLVEELGQGGMGVVWKA